MNYIRQLSLALMRFSDDERMNPSHISLYLALFQCWNLNRFQNPISVNRSEVMRISKIGSGATYHRCMRQLNDWKYLEYKPSHNPMKGSVVNMFNFDTSDEQVEDNYCFKNEQVLKQVPEQVVATSINSINNNKQINNKTIVKENQNLSSSLSKEKKTKFSIPDLQGIKSYFLEKQNTITEAEKFYNYYESNGWLVGGKTKMKDWKAAARNWILNAKRFQKPDPSTNSSLHVNENKRYDIPL